MADEPSHPAPQHPHANAMGNSTRGSPRGPPGGRRAQPPGENAAPHGEHKKGGRGGADKPSHTRAIGHNKTRFKEANRPSHLAPSRGGGGRRSQPPSAKPGERGRPTSPATPAPHGTHRGDTGVADRPSHPAPNHPNAHAMGSRSKEGPARVPGGRHAQPPGEQPTTGTQEGRAQGGRQAQPPPRHWT